MFRGIFFPSKYCVVENYTVVWVLVLASKAILNLLSRQPLIRWWLSLCNLYFTLLDFISYQNTYHPSHSNQVIEKCLPKNKCQLVFDGCLLHVSGGYHKSLFAKQLSVYLVWDVINAYLYKSNIDNTKSMLYITECVL